MQSHDTTLPTDDALATLSLFCLSMMAGYAALGELERPSCAQKDPMTSGRAALHNNRVALHLLRTPFLFLSNVALG